MTHPTRPASTIPPPDGTHEHTGGAITKLNLSAFTSGATRHPDAENAVGILRQCANGQDEWGLHVRTTGLEQAFVDRYTNPEGASVTHLETEFTEASAPRDFTFRKTKNDQVTEMKSTDYAWKFLDDPVWPNQAAIHIERSSVSPPSVNDPLDADLVALTGWAEGEGGDLNTCSVTIRWDLGNDCWVFGVSTVVERDGAKAEVSFSEEVASDSRSDFRFQNAKALGEFAVQGFVPQWAASAWSDAEEEAEEFATSVKMVTSSAIDGAKQDLLQFDLDGVGAWANEIVTFLDHEGGLDVDHSAPGHSLDIDADNNATFDGATIYNETEYDAEENETYNEMRRSGDTHRDGTVMDYVTDNEHFDVPNCLWNEETQHNDTCQRS